MLAACLVALAACGAPFDDAGYLGVADRLQPVFASQWDESAGRYEEGGGGVESTINANLLSVHAIAAQRGYRGPSRQDHRARVLVRSLLATPPYVSTLPPRIDGSSQWHAPGWVSSMHHLRSGQHVMVDSEVVDGLAAAWSARRELGLSRQLVRRLVRRIHAVARGRFWRWPAIRLNQFNWYARIYSADALVTGRSRMLRHDLRLQIARFARDVHGNAARAGNLGPGLRFHYVPAAPMRARQNFDSTEYANIVASFTRFYDDARRRGMAAPRPAERALLRGWLRRVLAGYWTHGGYLNWDTGLGFRRWHQSKKLGLSQHALLGMASAHGLVGKRTRTWAKWMLDRSLAFYERQARRNGGLAPGLFFGVHVRPQSLGSARLAAARVAANAARAVAAALGSMRAVEPPPLYAFDPDTGRLAVTTPAYNTAIVPVSQGAFPYGGIELARLFDGDQEVAASIGGRPPAAFGVVVKGVLATQVPRTQLGGHPLRLTRAPSGVNASLSARRAFAGRFRDLRATGVVSRGGVTVRTNHRFTAGFVESRWSIHGAARREASVLFPSWGRGAHVVAVRGDGRRIAVGRTRLSLRGIARLCVFSERSGYAVALQQVPARADVHVLLSAAQSSDPRPGPTAAVRILRPGRRGHVAMAVRLDPKGPHAPWRGGCAK